MVKNKLDTKRIKSRHTKKKAMAANQLLLKLLIDNKTNRVLFAEAGKDVVDFLFSLLAMPVGSIIKLLTKESMVGCIGSLYKSVETLDETYIVSNQSKTWLLNPTTALPSKNTLFLTESSSATTAKKFYRCTNNFNGTCNRYYTDVCNARCSQCRSQMGTEIVYVGPNPGAVANSDGASGDGFVKGVATYTIMDDLTVMPMSTISSITLLNKFQVKDVGSLEERTVNLGMKEGLELLKASLQSKTVLTDVFIGRKEGDTDG